MTGLNPAINTIFFSIEAIVHVNKKGLRFESYFLNLRPFDMD